MTAAPAGIAELAPRVPLLPQQQRAIRVRHRDQWEADDVLGRAIADAEAGSRRTGASSCVPRAPSPSCG